MIRRRVHTCTRHLISSTLWRVATVAVCLIGVVPTCVSRATAEDTADSVPVDAALSADPTAPGEALARLLTSAAGAAPDEAAESVPVADAPSPRDLRLKGLVIRDADHGTALLSINGGRSYVVSLHRRSLETAPYRITVGDVEFTVVDFDHSSVTLQDSQTGRRYFVR